MNVVQICNSDIKGGAARAAFSINDALRSVNVNSSMLVQKKISDSDVVDSLDILFKDKVFTGLRIGVDYFSIQFFTKKEHGRFSFPYIGKNISQLYLIKNADIIHLHWINEGFLSLKNLEQLFSLGKPVVWTLHDMWTFTGGCHYAGDCENYKSQCQNCPSLKISGKNDYSSKIFRNKLDVYKNHKLNIVTCSKWLADCARKSSLLKNHSIFVIPNPININIYKPIDKKIARKVFNLPEDKFLILFGTMSLKDERKGFIYLKNSLNILYDNFPELRTKIEVVVFGAFEKGQTLDIPFNTNFLGRISDVEKLVACYNSADVFVAPSIEDNLPNTVMEALSCGVPVAAFNIGGMPDMIDHKGNGFLVKEINADKLKTAIKWILDIDETLKKTLSNNARKKVVENFNPSKIANSYLNLYQELLSSQ